MTTDTQITALICRAQLWGGSPSYESDHEGHFFSYGGGIYSGYCTGWPKRRTDEEVPASSRR
jgi:hypothetical protein